MNLDTQTLEYNIRLGANVHAPVDGSEIVALERVALEDPGVQAEIAKLKLPEGAVVVCDPWIYGTATPFEMFEWLLILLQEPMV